MRNVIVGTVLCALGPPGIDGAAVQHDRAGVMRQVRRAREDGRDAATRNAGDVEATVVPAVRGACLGLIFLAVSGGWGPVGAAAPVASVRVQHGRLLGSSKGLGTTLRFRASNGVWQRIVVGGQADVPIGPLTSLELLGETRDGVVLLSASYASREGFPEKQCGAGSETIVRVLQLRPKLHQTFSQLVDSCWASIEGGEQRWQASDQTLHLETTSYAADKTMHQEAIYRVAPDGTTALLSTRQLE